MQPVFAHSYTETQKQKDQPAKETGVTSQGDKVLYQGRLCSIVHAGTMRNARSLPEPLVYKVPKEWDGPVVLPIKDKPGIVTIIPRKTNLWCIRSVERELAFLKRLDHENICQLVMNAGGPEPSLCLVFYPYVLSNLLATYDVQETDQGAMIAPVAINHKLINHLCKGLCYLHSKNIVHCGISPENLLVSGAGTLKITDFSEAKTKGEFISFLENMNVELAYLSPDRGAALTTCKMVEATDVLDWWGAGIVALQVYKRDSHVLAGRASQIEQATFLKYKTKEDVKTAVVRAISSLGKELQATLKATEDKAEAELLEKVAERSASRDAKSFTPITAVAKQAEELKSELCYFAVVSAFLLKWVQSAPDDVGFSNGHALGKPNFRAEQPPHPGLAYSAIEQRLQVTPLSPEPEPMAPQPQPTAQFRFDAIDELDCL